MTKWFDLLDLSKQKKLLDLGYIYPRGVREGIALIFVGKSVLEKHPSGRSWEVNKRSRALNAKKLEDQGASA